METRFSNDTARIVGMAGAAAWLMLAVAWQVSAVFDARQGWEGPATWFFFVGLMGLLLGGLALAAMALHPAGPPARPRTRIVGLALLGVALVVSFIAGWAVPVWALAYGAAMLVLASSRTGSTPAWIAGIALVAAPIALLALSAMEVGSADVYGDYPVAWQTAWWIAGVGAALGLASWARSLPADEQEPAVARP